MPSTEVEPSKGRLSELRVGLWVVALLFSLFCLALLYLGQGKGSGAATDSEMANAIGGSFTLTAPDGSTVTDRTLAGKPFAIFFGFTRCPDVCPTNLARMARLRAQLKGDGDKFAIVFVSVDPEQDTPKIIGDYVKLFGTPIIGLTGSQAQLEQIKKAYAVFSAKVPMKGGGYTIDHTAATYLMTRDGKFAGTIDHQEDDADALQKLKQLVA